jgi:hypothetical protein
MTKMGRGTTDNAEESDRLPRILYHAVERQSVSAEAKTQ